MSRNLTEFNRNQDTDCGAEAGRLETEHDLVASITGVDGTNLSSRDGELLFEETLKPEIFAGDRHNVSNQRQNGHLCKNRDRYITTATLSEESSRLELRDKNFRKFLIISEILTFRIVVRKTSNARPINLRNDVGRGDIRVGTGNAVLDHRNELFGNDRQIIVKTHHSLVYDDEEAAHTDVEWLHLYQHLDRSQVLHVSHIVPGNTSNETNLVCTVGAGMRREIIKQYDAWLCTFNEIPSAIKDLMLNKVIVFGHPHGGIQAISVGPYTLYDYTTTSERGVRRKRGLVHSAATCPGTTGAAVVIFKCESGCYEPEVWMHGGQGMLRGELYNISVITDIAAAYEESSGLARSPSEVLAPVSPTHSSEFSRVLSFPPNFTQEQKMRLASMGFLSADKCHGLF